MTPFEQATLEQLVSFRAKTDSEVEALMSCPKLQQQAIEKVAEWDSQRLSKGLTPWNKET